MKVVDKMNESIKAGRTFFSFEFFPPRTDEVRRSDKQKISMLSMQLLDSVAISQPHYFGASHRGISILD